jgi:hypothetical protein
MYIIKKFSFCNNQASQLLDPVDYFRGRLINDEKDQILISFNDSELSAIVVKADPELHRTIEYLEIVNALSLLKH